MGKFCDIHVRNLDFLFCFLFFTYLLKASHLGDLTAQLFIYIYIKNLFKIDYCDIVVLALCYF